MNREELARNLVGPIEIAERAGVTRDAVEKWRRRHPDTFPEPVVRLASGPLWWWPDVEPWLAIPRPPGRPPRGSRP